VGGLDLSLSKESTMSEQEQYLGYILKPVTVADDAEPGIEIEVCRNDLVVLRTTKFKELVDALSEAKALVRVARATPL
jgi:hypothetical protein